MMSIMGLIVRIPKVINALNRGMINMTQSDESKIDKLIDELKSDTTVDSIYEAYAMALEKVEKAKENMLQVENGLSTIWDDTKGTLKGDVVAGYRFLRSEAVSTIRSLVQVCDICDKLLQTREKTNG